MVRFAPTKTLGRITDPKLAIVGGIIESVTTLATGFESYHCGNCEATITRKISEWPKRCSECGEEIDWLEIAILKKCPECDTRYYGKKDRFCSKHDWKVDLVPLR